MKVGVADRAEGGLRVGSAVETEHIDLMWREIEKKIVLQLED